jgi:hypothetical protein
MQAPPAGSLPAAGLEQEFRTMEVDLALIPRSGLQKLIDEPQEVPLRLRRVELEVVRDELRYAYPSKQRYPGLKWS